MKNKHIRAASICILFILTISLSLVGCSSDTSAPRNVNTSEASNINSSQSNQDTKPAPESFINKVWQVSKSNAVAPGQIYVFLSEGTLVITSPNSKPAFGSWTYANGKLTMIEEGISYQTDILKLDENEFNIRMHNPGEAVEINLIPAEHLPLKK